LLWVVANSPTLGADPSRIVVAGDSAGGNLAAVVAQLARDRDGPKLRAQILLYPSLDLSRLNRQSMTDFASGFFLTRQRMAWFIDQYVPDRPTRSNPMASPLLATNHQGLPPAIMITAQFDPQRELDDLEFVLEQLRNFDLGLLSSSPMLWPSFRCALSIAKINDYLSVYEAVSALPDGHKARMLTVGKQLCLVPKAVVKPTDSRWVRAEKHKKMSQLTSQYFAKGQAIVQNAARGVFPSTVPVRKSG